MPDLADLAGRAVAVPIAGLTRLRGTKPMHPRGVLFSAVLECTGPPRPWGVDWLDEQRARTAVVRFSRGIGLPGPWPDLQGLAVRIPATDPGGRPVDQQLSSTGRGRVSRWLPVLRRDAATVHGSLMSYRTAIGRVRLAALPDGPAGTSDPARLAAEVARRGLRFTLAASLESGAWEPFARLRVVDPARPLDPEVHVDAVLNAPPGLHADGLMARFRRPAYAAARREREDRGAAPGPDGTVPATRLSGAGGEAP